MHGILCRKPLLRDKPIRPVADWVRRSLALPAHSGQPKHFRLPVRERAQSGFVIMHERPNEFDFALIGPANDLQAGQRLDLNPGVERIVERPLEAIIIEVNELHLVGARQNKAGSKRRVEH